MPKFGRKVPHLRCDSHTSFKVKRSKVRVGGGWGNTASAEPGGHTACIISRVHTVLSLDIAFVWTWHCQLAQKSIRLVMIMCNQLQRKTSASARCTSTNVGVQLKLCATTRPLFNGNISVADCMPLYLSYSKLLKLSAALNAGVYEKLAILDEYLVDHCWMLMHDHHLDDQLSLSHLSRRRPHLGAIKHVHSWMSWPCMSGLAFVTDHIAEMLKNATYFCS